MMVNYFIRKSLLPTYKKHKYLRDGPLYDYLGQILIQKGFDIPDKTRTPEDLSTPIVPFTRIIRGKPRNTELTLAILQLDYFDPLTHPQKLEGILSPYNITLTWVK